MNRTKFFARMRGDFGAISKAQVAGTEIILDGWETGGNGRRQHLSYMLATTWHETASTMQPIAEYGLGKGRKYGKPGRNGGQVAYGRGFVQLTWDDNYELADKKLGLNGALIKNYNLALTPEVAYKIMYRGMTEGWFTGKKLTDYIIPGRTDFLNARRIINGTDKMAMIAGYAEHFDEAILYAVT